MSQKGYQFLIFSKAISRRVIKIPVDNGGVVNRHRPRAAGYLNSGLTYQQMRFSKSLWRNGYYFINGYDLFYNERNSPESLQAYNPALGGYQLLLATIQDNSRMTRLHYYDYSRLMGATHLDFI